MPHRPKMHALRRMPHTAEEHQRYTRCQRHVPRERLAAFEEGVTCKHCLEAIRSDREWEQELAARRANKHAGV